MTLIIGYKIVLLLLSAMNGEAWESPWFGGCKWRDSIHGHHRPRERWAPYDHVTEPFVAFSTCDTPILCNICFWKRLTGYSHGCITLVLRLSWAKSWVRGEHSSTLISLVPSRTPAGYGWGRDYTSMTFHPPPCLIYRFSLGTILVRWLHPSMWFAYPTMLSQQKLWNWPRSQALKVETSLVPRRTRLWTRLY